MTQACLWVEPPRRWRIATMATLVLLGLVGWSLGHSIAKADLQPDHDNHGSVQGSATFIAEGDWGFAVGTVDFALQVDDSVAWYTPGPPPVQPQQMLTVVRPYTQEISNVMGIQWDSSISSSVASVGSLNSYYVYWGNGTPGGHEMGCNIVVWPVPHQCWRAAPDWWGISPSLTLSTTMNAVAALPWMLSGPIVYKTVSFPWW